MKSICVFCGSADAVHAGYIEGARLMGRTLAERGIRLIYGGGKTGLMGVVADAVLEAGGVVVRRIGKVGASGRVRAPDPGLLIETKRAAEQRHVHRHVRAGVIGG